MSGWEINTEPHTIDPWLTSVQRQAYSTEEKDGLLQRTLAAQPDFLDHPPVGGVNES